MGRTSETGEKSQLDGGAETFVLDNLRYRWEQSFPMHTTDQTTTTAGRFAALCALSGLSFAALDALAGKSKPGHAAMIAAGRRESPRPESLSGYASVLGTTVAYLLLGEGKAPSERAVKAAVERAKRVGG